jgi:hypothetical protein
MSRSVVALSLLSALALGCSGRSPPPDPAPTPPAAETPPAGCEAQPGGCGNVVDRVVSGMLAQSGRMVLRDSAEALCRRTAIDLTGLPPTDADVRDRCAGRSPEEIVRSFMDRASAPHVPGGQAPYPYLGRRYWADLFQYQVNLYDLNTTFYGDVIALDELVRKLYAGQLGYDAFAVEALASPAFVRRFGLMNAVTDLPAIASAAYRIFLGREALPSDAADLGNLWRPLGVRLATAPNQQRYYEVVLRGGVCSDAAALLCQSSVLGTARVTPTLAAGAMAPLSQLSGADADQVRKVGRLIVARREFAEAAVDGVLRRYLGWWNAGTYRPDYNLPAVREALADFFIAHGYRLRDLELEVLTSVLYTQPQALAPGEIAQAPLWAHGPTKALPAEVFLDTLQAVTKVQLGGCDFRFALNAIRGGSFYPQPPGAYTFPVSAGFDAAYYTNAARKMGGCPGGADRPEPGGLVAALAKREVLVPLCRNASALAQLVPALGSEVAPAQGLPQLLQHQLRLALGRAPADGERAGLVGLAEKACPSDYCDYRQVGAQLCMSLLASTLFNTY